MAPDLDLLTVKKMLSRALAAALVVLAAAAAAVEARTAVLARAASLTPCGGGALSMECVRERWAGAAARAVAAASRGRRPTPEAVVLAELGGDDDDNRMKRSVSHCPKWDGRTCSGPKNGKCKKERNANNELECECLQLRSGLACQVEATLGDYKVYQGNAEPNEDCENKLAAYEACHNK